MVNAYWFTIFNALSFQMVLAGPMILYARSLGASATVLGIVAGMMPVLTIAQLPAARLVGQVGYKRFVVGGWTIRVVFIFLMALVPLAGGFLDAATRLVAMIVLLFAFNLSRGISSCAWLPWITGLVPPEIRGRYLSNDQFFLNAASGGAFVLAALILGGEAGAGRFSLVFLFGAVTGAVSLLFLRRMPDHPVPEEERRGAGRVPWLALSRFGPFRRLLELNLVWSLAYGGLSTFVIAFLRADAGLGERRILLLMSLSFAGGLASFWLAGARLDRLGSKPVLGFTMAAGVVATAGWCLVSGGILPAGPAATLPLVVLIGLMNALFSSANNRLAMTIVPAMGRSHFFALFMVVWQLSLGLSPVVWGLLLDLIGTREFSWLGGVWTRYSVFFALAGLVFVAAFWLTRRIEEPKAASADALLRELLLESPQRWANRLLGRG